MVSEGSNEKYGSKLNISAVIQRTLKTLIGLYAEKYQDDKSEETIKFKRAFEFRSPEMFANARYCAIQAALNCEQGTKARKLDSTK